jgi:hypothetical protein
MAQDNSDRSINTNAPSVVQTESNKLMPVVVILSSLSLAASLYAVSVSWETKDRAKEQYETSLREQKQQFDILWDKYQITEREARVAQDDVTNYVKRGGKYKQR